MKILFIFLLLAFSIVVCIKYIPQMLSNKYYKDLTTFSILLVLGTTMAIFRIFDVSIPNPSDWLKWVYSPVADFFR